MYTYETAMARLPESARQSGPRGDSGVASAFRWLEQRGASDNEWESLITRIGAHHGGIAPGFSDDFRARVLALLS